MPEPPPARANRCDRRDEIEGVVGRLLLLVPVPASVKLCAYMPGTACLDCWPLRRKLRSRRCACVPAYTCTPGTGATIWRECVRTGRAGLLVVKRPVWAWRAVIKAKPPNDRRQQCTHTWLKCARVCTKAKKRAGRQAARLRALCLLGAQTALNSSQLRT